MRMGQPPSYGVVKLLLDAGADVDQADKNGQTALIAAVFTGNAQLVKLLLDHGADVNHVEVYDLTPLMCARGGPVRKLLLNAGASAKALDSTWRTR